MYKDEIVNKEVMETHKFCDVCDKEITMGLACSAAKCEQCGKDLCESCIGYEECSCGDYRTVYCKRCWDIGCSYRKVIKYLEDEIDCLYKEWKDECDATKDD